MVTSVVCHDILSPRGNIEIVQNHTAYYKYCCLSFSSVTDITEYSILHFSRLWELFVCLHIAFLPLKEMVIYCKKGCRNSNIFPILCIWKHTYTRQFITVLADVLAPLSTKPSADTLLITRLVLSSSKLIRFSTISYIHFCSDDILKMAQEI